MVAPPCWYGTTASTACHAGGSCLGAGRRTVHTRSPLSCLQISLLTPVAFDWAGYGAHFGDVVQQVGSQWAGPSCKAIALPIGWRAKERPLDTEHGLQRHAQPLSAPWPSRPWVRQQPLGPPAAGCLRHAPCPCRRRCARTHHMPLERL